MLSDIHSWVKSTGKKPWQVYLLGLAVISGAGLYFEIGLFETVYQSVERSLQRGQWLVLLAIQGVLIGFAAEFLYEQGDGYAKSGSYQFGSKDRILLFRVGVMTVLSGIVTIAFPELVNQYAVYPTVQMLAAIFPLGISLVHTGTRNWNIGTEWPAVLGGTMLAIAPTVT